MPLPAMKTNLLSQAAMDLGVGTTLPDQLKDETEEQRRRRLLMQQMQEAVSPFGATASLGLGQR